MPDTTPSVVRGAPSPGAVPRLGRGGTPGADAPIFVIARRTASPAALRPGDPVTRIRSPGRAPAREGQPLLDAADEGNVHEPFRTAARDIAADDAGPGLRKGAEKAAVEILDHRYPHGAREAERHERVPRLAAHGCDVAQVHRHGSPTDGFGPHPPGVEMATANVCVTREGQVPAWFRADQSCVVADAEEEIGGSAGLSGPARGILHHRTDPLDERELADRGNGHGSGRGDGVGPEAGGRATSRPLPTGRSQGRRLRVPPPHGRRWPALRPGFPR